MNTIERRDVKKVSYYLSLALMAVHVLLFFFFLDYHVTPMVLASAVSAVLYGLTFTEPFQKRYTVYVSVIFFQVVLYSSLAIFCVGWDFGFQVPLVILALLAFFGEFVGKVLERRSIGALQLSIMDALVYLVMLTVSRFHPAPYPLPDSVKFEIHLVMGVLCFTAVIVSLNVFLGLATHSERVLTNQAATDRLTGLYNRAGYDEVLASVTVATTVMLLVDADKFKHVNDNYGHDTGDRVLKKIARSLTENFRSVDHVCRIGGDEFVVLMINTEDHQKELISRKITRINRELSHTENDGLPIVSVSVGVCFGSDVPDVETMFEHADQALYKVKQAGGRGCGFYEEPAE